jgi:hypothetical protein
MTSGQSLGTAETRYTNCCPQNIRSRKLRLTTVGIRCADSATPLCPQKLALNFANKWRSLSRYSSLAD